MRFFFFSLNFQVLALHGCQGAAPILRPALRRFLSGVWKTPLVKSRAECSKCSRRMGRMPGDASASGGMAWQTCPSACTAGRRIPGRASKPILRDMGADSGHKTLQKSLPARACHRVLGACVFRETCRAECGPGCASKTSHLERPWLRTGYRPGPSPSDPDVHLKGESCWARSGGRPMLLPLCTGWGPTPAGVWCPWVTARVRRAEGRDQGPRSRPPRASHPDAGWNAELPHATLPRMSRSPPRAAAIAFRGGACCLRLVSCP